MRLGAVRAAMDKFRRRHAGNGPMEFVLHCFEKGDAFFRGGVVIHAGGVNISYFLVEAPLRGADVLNAPQKLFKIIKRLVRVFQPLVIQHKTFDDEFPKPLRGPDTKPGATWLFTR